MRLDPLRRGRPAAGQSRQLAMPVILLLFIWCAALPEGEPAWGAVLRAGVAKADITPPPGVDMWGYARRKSPAKGMRDPLTARVLVLDAGAKRLALVTVDLGRPFGPASLEKIRSTAKASCHVTSLLVAASHTHSGPTLSDEYPKGPPAWETVAISRIGKAIRQACGRLREVRIGTGRGIAYVGHNRLRHNPDGTVVWFERNPTRVPTSPFDPTVGVFRIDTTDGEPLAILVNYACHAVVFGPDNLEYSADYPGVMRKVVEEAFGGKPLCFFLQGAAGDINPLYAVTPLAQDAVKRRDWTGRTLGEEAARVAKRIRTEAGGKQDLQINEDTLTFHLRWDPKKLRQAIIKIFGPGIADKMPPSIPREMRLPVTTVLINKRIALMTVPGEAFVDFQIDWRARCPVRENFFLGYTNGDFDYFPTIRAASEGGYGAGNASTRVEVGAGERMVNHAIVKIYEMLGRLTDVPRDAEY